MIAIPDTNIPDIILRLKYRTALRAVWFDTGFALAEAVRTSTVQEFDTTKFSAVLTIVAVACGFAIHDGAQAAASPEPMHAEYVAHLQPVNAKVSGSKTTGEARFSVDGDKLTITIKVKGAQPDLEHWQHFHGFKDNHAASCPGASADVNGDGVIDIVETEPASGTTMVPFDADPVGMDVPHGVYPKASANGTYEYRSTVSLKALDAAFLKALGDSKIDLDRRVVMIHGVSAQTTLPSSVASLGPIPARVTLPIACGRIERVSGGM